MLKYYIFPRNNKRQYQESRNLHTLYRHPAFLCNTQLNMKPIRIFLILLLATAAASAQEPREIVSKHSALTIYLQGAEVVRTSTINLEAGTHELVFNGLESQINAKSIQVYAPKELVVLGVLQEINYLKELKKPTEVIRWEDSLKQISLQVNEINSTISVLEQERQMILQNQKIGGTEQGLLIENLQKAADFFRTRLTDIYAQTAKLNEKKTKLQETTNRLNSQLSQFNQKRNQPSNQIVVKVLAEKPGSFPLEVSYFVQSAGWTPRYDLRASGSKDQVQLKYRADLFQNTGCDWENVSLTLSTANPNIDNTSPTLNPWYLDFYTYSYDQYNGYDNAPVSITDEETVVESKKELEKTGIKQEFNTTKNLSDFTVMKQSFTNVQFEIALAQTIPSDGKMHQVAIQDYMIPAQYEYYCVPKLDQDAFLMTSIREWGKYNLLPGKVFLFLEGTYVGESWLNTTNPDDSLRFSLGRDKNVIVKREQVTDFTSTKMIGTNTLKTFTYDISVRNNKQKDIDLVLLDQVPVSSNKDITVEIKEITGAQHTESSGLLRWTMDIKPGETVKKRISYSVKYPKNETVNGL